MGNLRDALKKAKVISDKEARRLKHEERVHRKEVGRKGVEQEQGDKQAALEKLRTERRQQDKAQQAELEGQRKLEAELAACREILRREARKPQARGGHRWYMQLADGSLPSLELTATDRLQVMNGQCSVLRRGPPDSHDYALLQSQHAKRVAKVMPELLVWPWDG